MKLCQFSSAPDSNPRPGLILEDQVIDLSRHGETLASLLESPDLAGKMAAARASAGAGGTHPLDSVTLLAPVARQEIWAAGVTYLRSKKARMEESDFSATAYDRVYEAARPEIFFKSLPDKVVGPGGAVGIRRDARWNVPEPELVLVFNAKGDLVGYTIGNDMSSRDIEGENLLYLPQAKIYDRSCAIGPLIEVGAAETDARNWIIRSVIERDQRPVFSGETSVANIKRTFGELKDYLFRSQTFPQGVMLFTGTGIVPNDDFTLQTGDVVRIEIDGIGTLENAVTEV